MASREFSTWHFLAIFNVSDTVISGILPLELKPSNALRKQIESNLLHQDDATTGISNLLHQDDATTGISNLLHQDDATTGISNLPLILRRGRNQKVLNSLQICISSPMQENMGDY